MRRIAARSVQVVLLALTATAGCADAPPSDAPRDPSSVAIVDVDVIPMDRERVLEGHTVVVRGDRIVELGGAGHVDVPDDARRIDGSGGYLIPGLTESHGHVPSPEDEKYLHDVLFLWIANGVTTVRGMLGEPGHLEVRRRANSGEILAPTLYLAGPALGLEPIASPGEAAETVRTQQREGWDFIKVVWGPTRAEYDAITRTAREVGIPVVGHVPREVGVLEALEAGQETIEHLDGYLLQVEDETGAIDNGALADVVARTRDAGVRVVPTMAVWEVILGELDPETLAAYPELRYMPPELVAGWTEAHRGVRDAPDFDPERAKQAVENRMTVLRALHDGGVPVLLGTDSPQFFSVPGFSLRRELRRMVDAGMTPWEILAAGTRNVGSYLADKDDFGTIAPGRRADLVLLDSNPLEDVMNVTSITGVMVRGHWIPVEEIQARLDDIAASYQESPR